MTEDPLQKLNDSLQSLVYITWVIAFIVVIIIAYVYFLKNYWKN